ncbi:S8 family peptidase [Deinococcus knuensis]|nr:S8 family serine peptidase [Deinococcus knuensis]
MTALTTLLLAACATTPHTPQTTRPDTIITIPTTTATTNTTLEQQYGGTIALRTDTFAIIANPTRQPLTAQGGKQHKAEKNKDAVNIDPSTKSENVWSNVRYDGWNNSFSEGLPENAQSWDQIELKATQESNHNGSGQIVAVIDTGVDLDHPIFYNNLVSNELWFDYVDNDHTPEDEGSIGQAAYGHGTFVSGVVLQIAPAAKIMPLRVLNSVGSGDTLDVASAIIWATDKGANVINLSLGTAQESDAITMAVTYANSKNVLVVAAAGNSNKDTLDFPAQQFSDSKLNISVGSVNSSDVKSAFSSYGMNLGLMAPGENIQSAFPDNRTAIMSGTSMSAPVVSGAIAVGLSTLNKPEVVLSSLINSSTNINEIYENSSFRGKLGSGRINMRQFIDDLN